MISLPFGSKEFKDIKSCITIGVFDGIHRGHASILGSCKAASLKYNACSVVVTFTENPKMVCGSEHYCSRLCSKEDFEEILFNAGIDYLCTIDFSQNISRITGRQFMELLCSMYNIVSITEGSSFRCGRFDSSFGVSDIGSYLFNLPLHPFLNVVPSVYYDSQEISSSRIRKLLENGDTDKVSVLLGRRYSVDLRNVVPDVSSGRLFYRAGSVGQFLPGNGTYRVVASAGNAAFVLNPDPSGVDTFVVISDGSLAFELPLDFIPDRIYFL